MPARSAHHRQGANTRPTALESAIDEDRNTRDDVHHLGKDIHGSATGFGGTALRGSKPPRRLLHNCGPARHLPRYRSEYIDLHISLWNVDAAARAQLVMPEAFAVHAQRQIIIDTGRQVRPIAPARVLYPRGVKIQSG